jgi:hypothetical protein
MSRKFAVLSCLLLGGLSALADVNVTFTGVNGVKDFGYYVGPDNGTINGDPVTLYSVDFANAVHLGEIWRADLTSLAGGDLSNTRYGGIVGPPDGQQLYEEAAWLTTQYASNLDDYGDIQTTIWQLFDPNAPAPSSGYWLQMAEDNYTSLDLNDFDVVTNLAPVHPTGQVQEYIIDPPSVPEPSSLVLLLTTLLALAFVARKRLARVP